jgi:pimeloyl-ACP methyl ester carboxylesterase
MLKGLLIALTTSYLAWFVARYETQVVYPFDPTYTDVTAIGEPRLAEFRVRTADGESLVVWAGAGEPGRPTVLYLLGNAGTLAGRAVRFRTFLDQGYGVVAFAYRGSSGSTGAPTETALTADARAIAAAMPRFLGREPDTLILYGESLGAAIAIKLAAEGTGDGLILQSPFTSIRDIVRAQYPQEDVAHLFREVWDSRAWIGEVRQPLLVLHGTTDRLVPFAQGETIHAEAGSRQKRLVALEGVGHNVAWTRDAAGPIFGFLAQF